MRVGIVRRVLLLGVVPVSIVAVILSLYFTSTRFDDLEVALQERGLAIARQLAPASEYGVFSGNREVLQRVAEAALQESDVRAVVIADRDGVVLVHSGEHMEPPAGAAPPEGGSMTQADRGVALVFSAPIRRAQITLEAYIDQSAELETPGIAPPPALGSVHVKVSRTGLIKKKGRLLADAFLITLVGLGIGAALALRLGRDVTRPVQTLTRAVERIGQGDLAVRVEARSAGELRVLEEGINAMADNLQALRENLEARIAQATRELADKKEEAERANAAKSRFLAAASHDLRQPLHALGLFVARLRDLAGETAAADGTAALGALVGRIEDSVGAINDLLDGLLDISRLDAGAMVPNVSAFPVQRVLERVEGEFAGMAREQGLRFRVRGNRSRIVSDPMLLERILRNLVSNAVRYTDHGGVLIGCRRRGGALRVEVWDTGVGIPQAAQGDVFREFYQVGGTGRGREKGLGLGLAIVDGLAKLLGHRVHLFSRLGRGSVFALEIPLAPEVAGVEARTAEAAPAGPAPSGLVYVIEDDALVLESMRELLRGWGCSVVGFATGDEAMGALDEGGPVPDLVICDYRLGTKENGLDLITGMRARVGADIPAVLVSGDPDPDLPGLAREAACHFLQKPVRPAKLRSLLCSVRLAVPGES
ncbi:MAG TPA: ATP-binding protein [Burkholderiales bacterium]|nr:ATP-binding protein [Burkholderiales bacterium]